MGPINQKNGLSFLKNKPSVFYYAWLILDFSTLFTNHVKVSISIPITEIQASNDHRFLT